MAIDYHMINIMYLEPNKAETRLKVKATMI